MNKQFKVYRTIPLNRLPAAFYDTAIFLYLLHFAVMADLTNLYPDTLSRFRMSSFALVALLATMAICSRFLRKQIPVRMLIFFLAFLTAILLSMARPENLPYIKQYFGEASYIKHVLLFALLFVYEENPRARIRQLTVIAAATLWVYKLGLDAGMFIDEETQNFIYMSFGYGCAPWWVIIAQGIFYYKKWWAKAACLAAAGYFAAMIVNYGNRGALAVIIIAVAVMLLVYVPLKHLVFLGTACAAALCGLLAFLQPVMAFLGEKLNFDLTQSRNFRLVSESALTYDSGRLPIIRQVLEGGILRHPMLGAGIGGDRVVSSEDFYTHNIVLELCIDYGVILGALIYCWLVYIGIRALFSWRDRDWKALFLCFYVFSMVELFFSGTLYESGYLMASVMIYLSYTTYVSPAPNRRSENRIAAAARPYP